MVPSPLLRRLATSLLLLGLGVPLLVHAGATGTAGGESSSAISISERSVKAAFLYKFLGYAEFPPTAFGDAAAPVVIGVLGAADLAAELGKLVAGRTVNQRPLVVRTLVDGDAHTGVHLLFVGGDDPVRVRNVTKAPAPGMLVVTEAEQGLQNGSVINFKIIEQRVRFDVSLEAADKNNVKLSSRLLTVANQVLKGAP